MNCSDYINKHGLKDIDQLSRISSVSVDELRSRYRDKLEEFHCLLVGASSILKQQRETERVSLFYGGEHREHCSCHWCNK